MKTAVLFIHGFMGHPGEFKIIDNYFKSWGFETYSIILSGHNKKKLKGITYNDWEQDCIEYIELLKKKGLKKIIVVGHSMGGILSTMLAIKYEDLICKLILIDPSFEYLVKENNKTKIISSFNNFIRLLKEVKMLNKNNYSPIDKCSLTSIKEFTKLVKEHKQDIYNIKCPILFLHGENDCIIPANQVKQIFEKTINKNNKIFIVKNGSHWFFSSLQEDIFYSTINSFLFNNNDI